MSAPSEYRPRPYRPSPWLEGPNLQTVVGRLLRPTRSPTVERIRLDTPDGDFLDVDVGPEPEGRDDAPIGLVLHGLEGSSRRSYVLVQFRALLSRGVRPVGMNFRGCSGEPNRAVRFYHSGETEDVDFVVARLRERFPGRPMGAVGFSLGGNVLLKYLGEGTGDRSDTVSAAATISVPFDLAAGADLLEVGPWGRMYTFYFLRKLRRKLRLKKKVVRGHADVEGALDAPTIRGFDEAVTAPIHGFESAEDYYRKSSSAEYLDGIRTPTLLLQSRDDPFLPRSALPEEAMHENPYLHPALTDEGGHVGFVEGPPWAPRFWAEEEAARFLAHHLRSDRTA